MKLKLSLEAVVVLNMMLREPGRLPLGRAGIQEFKCKDPAQAKLVGVTLKKWLHTKVFKVRNPEASEEKREFDIVAFEGTLIQSYCELISEILKHYQPVGMLVDYATPYSELLDVFSGKNPEGDSIEAITFEDVEKK